LISEVGNTQDFTKTTDKFIVELSKVNTDLSTFDSGLDADNLLTPVDLSCLYAEHIKSLRSGGMKTGVTAIDSRIRCVAKGEVLTILARPGCFKTALLQHMLLKFSNDNHNQVAVFFSLEMPGAGVYERFSQNILGLSGREIETRWKNSTMSVSELDRVNQAMSRVYTVLIRPTINQMKQYCRLIEKKSGKKVGLVGIDYLGLVSDAGRNEYERASKIAVDTKSFAKSQGVPVVLLSQLNRTGGDGTQPVTLDMARGSGQIEEAADFVIGLSRTPSTICADSLALDCGILKNRKGPAGDRFPLVVTPSTMQFQCGEYGD
jgi:replicative DNA helicase